MCKRATNTFLKHFRIDRNRQYGVEDKAPKDSVSCWLLIYICTILQDRWTNGHSTRTVSIKITSISVTSIHLFKHWKRRVLSKEAANTNALQSTCFVEDQHVTQTIRLIRFAGTIPLDLYWNCYSRIDCLCLSNWLVWFVRLQLLPKITWKVNQPWCVSTGLVTPLSAV